MDAGALGGLCCCGRDQVLATERPLPQGRTRQGDKQRLVQAVTGTDLGEGVLTHSALQNFIYLCLGHRAVLDGSAFLLGTHLIGQTDWAGRSRGRSRTAGGTSAVPPKGP